MFPHTWMCTSKELFLSGAESREIAHSWESQEESYLPARELSTQHRNTAPALWKFRVQLPVWKFTVLLPAATCAEMELLMTVVAEHSWTVPRGCVCDTHPLRMKCSPCPQREHCMFSQLRRCHLRHLASGNSAEPCIYFWRAPTGGRGSTGELAGGVWGWHEQMVWWRAISFPLAHWLH